MLCLCWCRALSTHDSHSIWNDSQTQQILHIYHWKCSVRQVLVGVNPCGRCVVEDPITYNFTLHVNIRDHTTYVILEVCRDDDPFDTHFLLGSLSHTISWSRFLALVCESSGPKYHSRRCTSASRFLRVPGCPRNAGQRSKRWSGKQGRWPWGLVRQSLHIPIGLGFTAYLAVPNICTPSFFLPSFLSFPSILDLGNWLTSLCSDSPSQELVHAAS